MPRPEMNAPPDPELTALEAALGSLSPASARIDRDRLMFLAGQARRPKPNPHHRFWPTIAACLAVVALTEATLLGLRPEPQVVERVVVLRNGQIPSSVAGPSEAGPSTSVAGLSEAGLGTSVAGLCEAGLSTSVAGLCEAGLSTHAADSGVTDPGYRRGSGVNGPGRVARPEWAWSAPGAPSLSPPSKAQGVPPGRQIEEKIGLMENRPSPDDFSRSAPARYLQLRRLVLRFGIDALPEPPPLALLQSPDDAPEPSALSLRSEILQRLLNPGEPS